MSVCCVNSRASRTNLVSTNKIVSVLNVRGDPVAYWVNHLMGNSDVGFPLESLADLYSELSQADGEHTDVSLTHESEWCLSAFHSGLLVWENVAGESEPKHMCNVPKEAVVELWSLLAAGSIYEIEKQNWLPGYGS